MKNKTIYSLQNIDQIAQQLAKEILPTHQVITFTGPLGAGKTTLIRSMLRNCGITEPITSPTFTYMNMYTNDVGKTFYHFDLYRIVTLDEFQVAGFDEYLYQPDSWALIEWPAIIMPLLTYDVCHITLDYGQIPEERIMHIICI